MTGGVSTATCEPVAAVYQFMDKKITQGSSMSIRNLNTKRFGHCSCFLRDRVLVFGGFAHKDVPEEPP